MSKKILVIGNTSISMSMNMNKLPGKGETVYDDGGVAYVPGGRGTSASIAFKRLGADAVLVSKLGRDLHGHKLYQYLKDMGVSTSYLKVDPESPTGLTVTVRECDGSQRKVVYSGANALLSADNVADAFSCMPSAVYTTLEAPMHILSPLLQMAEARSIPTVIDAVGVTKDYNLEALPSAEIFSPNEDETELLTGVRPLGADSSLRAALLLYKRVKCKYLIIKQGERGAFIYDGKHYFMIPPLRAGKAVDPQCVGDAFGAAMTISYVMNNRDIQSAVKYGVAVGALTITRKGGASSVPTLDEVEEFLSKSTM